ncbi:MAG: xanthine dehydrogenase family protein molybdopterin-binding subunit [Myxococcota bacterium]
MSTPRAFRNDAYIKVTGRAKYADDLKFHNMLYAVPVYTDYVHAKILSIETSEAEKVKGVIKVITYKDVPGTNKFGQIIKDYHIFADDKIRYNGDVVALIVAEAREIAISAQSLIKVEVQELEAVLDPDEALKPSSPLIHEERGNNIVNEHRVRKGDIEKGFAESDYIIEQDFSTQFVEHAYLEPESAICIPRFDGVFEIYGSMQHPFSTRRFVANLLGVRLSDVEIKTIPMGGGFGGKDDTAAIVCARAALAARLTGRPVKITYDREWSIRESYKRHPYKVYYKMGITKDGLIKAVKVRIIADAGAYCSVTPWVTWRSTVQCCGPYKVPNVWCDTYGVYTNNVFTGAMRGFGSPQINFCIEQLIEMAAERCGLNIIEFRKKNMLRQNDETITSQRLDNHKVSLEEVLDKVLKESDFENKYKKCSFGKSDTDELYGIGIAMSYRGVSLGAEGKDFNSAIINVQADGSILLEVAVHENGQGSESAMINILAEHLGVNRERIRYRMSSTSNIPDGGTTVASRGTIMGGGAVVNAVEILKEKYKNVLSKRFNVDRSNIYFRDDSVLFNDNKISFLDATKIMFEEREIPYAFGTFKAPDVSWDEEIGKGNAYFTWVYGCQAVELKVNKKSGKIKLLNVYMAHDVGKAINREMLLGQFYGGIAMGIGYGLLEEVKIENGKIISLNFNKYRIARSTDMPEIYAYIIENPDPNSPSRAKSIGEPTNELMAPAIANAIYAATGKRFTKIPIKIEGLI